MPRVLNMYSQTPVFTGYFASLGIKAENIVYSDYTSEELYKEGAKRGAIDPCFPSKLGIPHVHNLLYKVHAKKPLDIIFFPMIDCLTSDLQRRQASRSCPTVAATPEAVKAAFTKEGDLFAEKGVLFLDTFVNLSKPDLLERQLYEQFKDILGPVARREQAGRGARLPRARLLQQRHHARRRARGAGATGARGPAGRGAAGPAVSQRPRREPRNPGGVPEARLPGVHRRTACPSTTTSSGACSATKCMAGEIPHPMAITDVWKNSYSENTSRKVWAAKYVARHPNLVALELSSFKCGHDAPIYTVVEEIVEHSGTPYFCFKDIDENKPTGSIRIRVETIGYFLKRYREDMVRNKNKARPHRSSSCSEFEARLRRQMLREKLDAHDVRDAFETGAMPQIHVSVGALAASSPAARELERVSGD